MALLLSRDAIVAVLVAATEMVTLAGETTFTRHCFLGGVAAFAACRMCRLPSQPKAQINGLNQAVKPSAPKLLSSLSTWQRCYRRTGPWPRALAMVLGVRGSGYEMINLQSNLSDK